jgi:hypothetical protein
VDPPGESGDGSGRLTARSPGRRRGRVVVLVLAPRARGADVLVGQDRHTLWGTVALLLGRSPVLPFVDAVTDEDALVVLDRVFTRRSGP